jgi:aldose sugar dehydrogenase
MNRFLPSFHILSLVLLSTLTALTRAEVASLAPPITAGRDFIVDTVIAGRDVEAPLSLAFAQRDNAVFFFTEKNSGRVRIVERGRLNPQPFATLRVSSSGERGVLGVATHPSYPDSPFVYVLYNRLGDRANLVVRFRDSSAIGVHPLTLLVVPRVRGEAHHLGGKIRFGADEKLYVLLFEYGVPADHDTLAPSLQYGRILRINPDGTIPEDNPVSDDPVWSYGHRTPFDFCFDPHTSELLCTGTDEDMTDEVKEEFAGLHPHMHFSRALQGKEGTDSVSGILEYTGNAFPRFYGRLLVVYRNSPMIRVVSRHDVDDSLVVGVTDRLEGEVAGYSEIGVAPDGSLYLIGSTEPAGTIYRLRPIPPQFLSEPSELATQGVRYSYTPAFQGTPPSISIISGPEEMTVDSSTWSLTWVPSNEQALEGAHHVHIRATNGAGEVDQRFTVSVANVNDPPVPVRLRSPAVDSAFTFTGQEPTVHFFWGPSADIDNDSVWYVLQIDTVQTFASPHLLQRSVGPGLSGSMVLPRATRTYYWRVVVSDGENETPSTEFRRLSVAFVHPGRQEPQEETAESVLEQNFPNPFNPSTSIKYSIPKGGHVHLGVFNMLGQEIAVIFDGAQQAGTYEFEFVSADLPSGIYFYRIQAPDFIETRKMVITK